MLNLLLLLEAAPYSSAPWKSDEEEDDEDETRRRRRRVRKWEERKFRISTSFSLMCIGLKKDTFSELMKIFLRLQISSSN